MTDIQPETETGYLTGRRRSRPVKRRKDALPVLLGDPRTLVGDRHGSFTGARVAADRDVDATAGRAVFERVADEIVDHLLQPVGVPHADNARDCRFEPEHVTGAR